MRITGTYRIDTDGCDPIVITFRAGRMVGMVTYQEIDNFRNARDPRAEAFDGTWEAADEATSLAVCEAMDEASEFSVVSVRA